MKAYSGISLAPDGQTSDVMPLKENAHSPTVPTDSMPVTEVSETQLVKALEGMAVSEDGTTKLVAVQVQKGCKPEFPAQLDGHVVVAPTAVPIKINTWIRSPHRAVVCCMQSYEPLNAAYLDC